MPECDVLRLGINPAEGSLINNVDVFEEEHRAAAKASSLSSLSLVYLSPSHLSLSPTHRSPPSVMLLSGVLEQIGWLNRICFSEILQ